MTRLVTTVLGLGHLRPASGTWASAVAVAAGVGLHHLGHFPLVALAAVVASGLGIWACGRELRDRPGADPSEIVIDEVAGQWIALAFPSAGFWMRGMEAANFPWPGWVAAFVFFRLFDIWKPWIVGRADRRGDPLGVMLDDIIAGLMAGVATIIAAGVYHGILLR